MRPSDNRHTWQTIAEKTSELIALILAYRETFRGIPTKESKAFTISRLVHRVMRNLRGILAMAQLSADYENSTFLKLPVGLLIRNCLMDMIMALNISKHDEETCSNQMKLANHKYVKALFEEYEVYRDKIDWEEDEAEKEQMYTMALEDAYLPELEFNQAQWDKFLRAGEIEPKKERYIWKERDLKAIFKDTVKPSDQIKELKEKVSTDEEIGDCVRTLYAYYKYFSQYEHYSERGDGDSLADFGKDNIRFEKVFDHLKTAVKLSFV